MTPVDRRIAAVREAFRLRRVARAQRRLCAFYLEHDLLDAERDARRQLLDSLGRARELWRVTLGLAPTHAASSATAKAVRPSRRRRAT